MQNTNPKESKTRFILILGNDGHLTIDLLLVQINQMTWRNMRLRISFYTKEDPSLKKLMASPSDDQRLYIICSLIDLNQTSFFRLYSNCNTILWHDYGAW